MKNKEYNLSVLKHKVFSSKQERVLIKPRNQADVDYLESLGVTMTPAQYKVTPPARPGYIPRKSDPWIVRDVLSSHKVYQIRELGPSEVDALKRAGATVEEYRYWATKPKIERPARKRRKNADKNA